jgi:predicted DNA-binding transcriptional regulator AlpA
MLNAASPGKTELPPSTSHASEAVRLLPIEEVMLRSGMGRTALYARIKAGSFPAPAKVGSGSRWLSTEVGQWVRDVMALRPTKAA